MQDKHRPKRNTRIDLRDAAIRLGAREGIDGASIRTIAREVGVTEGAVYKHFANKDELIREAYTSIVEEMARDKAVLVNSDLSFQEAIVEWVKLSYQYFDANPDAFTYVLLMPHRLADTLGDVYTSQSRVFRAFIIRAQQSGEIRALDPDLVIAIVSGVIVNIPRLINEGSLPGPAEGYARVIAETIIRILVD
ncbi:MAG: TetR/AcrR family transcriptional regulator [Phycisphaerales bacterium]